MPLNDITLFAETTFRNQYRPFGIKTDDRRRHMYLIGKTGMGKSTILENMIIEDIYAGRGVAVVDPHGDLAEKIIEFIPSERVNDIVYFNPSDIDYPIAFNVVEQVEPHLRHLVASGLIGVFEKLWADSWGPRLEYILRNSILAILDYPNSTLLSITRMLSDKPFRKKVIEKIQDPVVKAFWTKEFAGYADKFASEAVSPIQNKVGQFLSSSLIRNIVGQVKSSIDLRSIMDEGKVLIMNLSKGRIGEDNSELLGAMMITKLQLAAMSRVNIHEQDRRDFYLYVDEFQNFATDSFANILSEARKYRLNLIMGHQYIEQLNENVKAAVFGNVGTLVVFRVGATDAEELVKEFLPVFTQEDLVNLPKYHVCLKLMIDGVASDPFSARGLPPLPETYRTDNAEKVIGSSRERYAAERRMVEDRIMRWHDEHDEVKPPEKKPWSQPQNQRPFNNNNSNNNNKNYSNNNVNNGNSGSNDNNFNRPYDQAGNNDFNNQANNHQVQNNQGVNNDNNQYNNNQNRDGYQPINNPDTYKHKVNCSRCGQETRVSFQPDGIRPVYCKECLTALKQEKIALMEERKKNKEKELERMLGPVNPTRQESPRQDSSRQDNQAHKKPEIFTQVKEEAPPTPTISLRDLPPRPPLEKRNNFKTKDEQNPNKEDERKIVNNSTQENQQTKPSQKQDSIRHGQLKNDEPIIF